MYILIYIFAAERNFTAVVAFVALICYTFAVECFGGFNYCNIAAIFLCFSSNELLLAIV